MSPRVNIVRIFADGDYVFAHTDYNFNVLEIGFEVFRFEDGQAVEHWDNLQHKHSSPNPAGHTMMDGPTEVTDLDKTEVNRALVRSFVEEILINNQLDRLEHYIDAAGYTEHNPHLTDGLPALHSALAESSSNGQRIIQYKSIHRLLAEGNFLLCVTEGFRSGVHSSFYDLFHVANGKIVEHWDTIEAVPARSEWVNDNGKF
jgi:predicted SnoaL-like aldol condensation-catalyzing enzyme